MKIIMGRVFNIVTLVLMLAGGATCHYLKRVMGGKACKSDEGQHHVVLTTPKDNNGHCGGSLLSPKWIITAAHCNESNLEVIIGKHHGKKVIRKEIEESDKNVFKDTQNYEHDLMLIQIDDKDTKDAYTIPLPALDSCTAPSPLKNVDIFGWMTAARHPTTNKKEPIFHHTGLQCGNLGVVACNTRQLYANCPDLEDYKFQHLLCAKDPNGRCDACEGDSGSSLLYDKKLHGVLVVGPNYFCMDDVRFMDICHCEYRKWIYDTTGGL